MSITTNENGTLYTLKTVTANENGTLYDLNKVYSNEDGTLYEIYTKESNPTSLMWYTGESSYDTYTSCISTSNNGFRVTVKGHNVPGTETNVRSSTFSIESGYYIYVTCLSATTSSPYHPKAAITIRHITGGTVAATAKDPSEGRFKLFGGISSISNNYQIHVSAFCTENGSNKTVSGVDAQAMIQIEFAKS